MTKIPTLVPVQTIVQSRGTDVSIANGCCVCNLWINGIVLLSLNSWKITANVSHFTKHFGFVELIYKI